MIIVGKLTCFSEQDLLRNDEKYEAFYSTFCTLAADYISSGISSGRMCFILRLFQYIIVKF